MKTAIITITYNDGYKLKEWYEHYLEYSEDCFIHIIVDNCSKDDYFHEMKELFNKSHIIRRNSNGGCTGAYNDGISYALSIGEVDSIMLLANDIRLERGSIDKLQTLLSKDKQLGMVAPILLEQDSMVVADFGCGISNTLIMKPFREGFLWEDVNENINYCEAITGGVNLSKREFYENVGMQDDKLFMYSDEVDMGIRAKVLGYKMAVIKSARAWHLHINERVTVNSRQPFTKYLAGRNKVYVANKHFGLGKALMVYLYISVGAVYKMITHFILRKGYPKDYLWMLRGAYKGLLGEMQENKFSKPKDY